MNSSETLHNSEKEMLLSLPRVEEVEKEAEWDLMQTVIPGVVIGGAAVLIVLLGLFLFRLYRRRHSYRSPVLLPRGRTVEQGEVHVGPYAWSAKSDRSLPSLPPRVQHSPSRSPMPGPSLDPAHAHGPRKGSSLKGHAGPEEKEGVTDDNDSFNKKRKTDFTDIGKQSHEESTRKKLRVVGVTNGNSRDSKLLLQKKILENQEENELENTEKTAEGISGKEFVDVKTRTVKSPEETERALEEGLLEPANEKREHTLNQGTSEVTEEKVTVVEEVEQRLAEFLKEAKHFHPPPSTPIAALARDTSFGSAGSPWSSGAEGADFSWRASAGDHSPLFHASFFHTPSPADQGHRLGAGGDHSIEQQPTVPTNISPISAENARKEHPLLHEEHFNNLKPSYEKRYDQIVVDFPKFSFKKKLEADSQTKNFRLRSKNISLYSNGENSKEVPSSENSLAFNYGESHQDKHGDGVSRVLRISSRDRNKSQTLRSNKANIFWKHPYRKVIYNKNISAGTSTVLCNSEQSATSSWDERQKKIFPSLIGDIFKDGGRANISILDVATSDKEGVTAVAKVEAKAEAETKAERKATAEGKAKAKGSRPRRKQRRLAPMCACAAAQPLCTSKPLSGSAIQRKLSALDPLDKELFHLGYERLKLTLRIFNRIFHCGATLEEVASHDAKSKGMEKRIALLLRLRDRHNCGRTMGVPAQEELSDEDILYVMLIHWALVAKSLEAYMFLLGGIIGRVEYCLLVFIANEMSNKRK